MYVKRHGLYLTVGAPRLLSIWTVGLLFITRAHLSSGEGNDDNGGNGFEIRIGTSVSRQGKFASTSAYMEKAFILFEEVVNANRPFKSKSGGNITVKLTMYDDKSDSATVQDIFTQMSASESENFDFLLGPYSSGLSLVAAKATNASGKLLMMNSAASPSVYVTDGSPRFNHVFASNPMADEYFQDGLERLHSMGARTLAVARGSATFHDAVCDGALGHATRIGYKVLDDFNIEGSDLTAGIRNSRALAPDVFVGCGHLSNVISIAVTSRALGFNPKAMLLTTSTSKAFVDAVEARNANFIMGPVTWVKETESRFCKVFGSSQGFYDMYVARWGLAPTYQAGMAALAGVIMMNAAELIGTPAPSSDALRTTLLESEIDTFAGNITFKNTGQRLGAKGHTQQILPDPAAATPAERYTQSRMELISNSNPAIFPAPTWEQRELLVYPCLPGYVRDRSSTDVAACVACPQGKSRNNASLVCLPCGANAYSDRPGLSDCHPCKVGMNCSEDYVGEPVSIAGYYRLYSEEKSEFSFHECDPPGLCLGANLCAGNNLGVLCDDCPPGYSNKGWGALGELRALCGECMTTWGSFLWFLGLVVMYLAYLVVLSICDHASSHSLSALHGVIIKIVINYGQFMSTMLLATEFPMLKEKPFLLNGMEFLLNPLQSMISFDCVAERFNIPPEKASVVIGILLLPVGLGLSAFFFVFFCFLLTRKVRHRRLRHNAIKNDGTVPSMFEVQSNCGAEFAPAQSKDSSRTEKSKKSGKSVRTEGGKSAKSATSRRAEPVVSVSDENSGGSTDSEEDMIESSAVGDEGADSDQPRRKESDDSVYSSYGRNKAGAEWGLPRVRLRDLSRMVNPNAEQEIKKHLNILWTRTAVISVYILHPIAIRMLLSGIDCVQLDELRLKKNMSIVCNEADHRWWFVVGICGIVLYGVCVPFATWKILYSIRERLLDIDERRRYGFLYNGFENSYYNFEVWYMIRKFLILFSVSIPEIYARTLTMLWMAFFFMGAQIVCRPWDNRGYFIFDKLETLSLLALIVSIALRLGLELRTDVTGGVRTFLTSSGFEIACVSFAIIPHAFFITLAAWSLVRNTVVKKLMFAKEILPGSLNHFQLFLCRLEAPRCHRMKMEPRSHQIDVSKLGNREKELLQSCLSSTLEHYMSADLSGRSEEDARIPPLLHFEYLGCAIREAFHRCERSRKKKMKKVVRDVRDAKKKTHQLAPWVLALGEDASLQQVRDEIRNHVSQSGITVEELQVSLMISWPDILSASKKKYYTLESHEDKEFILNEEARRDHLIYAPGRSLAKMVDILERRNALVKDTTKRESTKLSKAEVMETFTNLGLEAARNTYHSPELTEDPIGQYQAVLEEAMELHEQIEQLKRNCIRAALGLDTYNDPMSLPQLALPEVYANESESSLPDGRTVTANATSLISPERALQSDEVVVASVDQVDVDGLEPPPTAESPTMNDIPTTAESIAMSNVLDPQVRRPSPIESALTPFNGTYLPNSTGSLLPRSALTPLETEI